MLRARVLTSFGVTLLVLAAIGVANPCPAALINLTPTNGVNSDTSVSLGSLASGDTTGITVGDKIFTGFVYSRIGDMPDADDINVLGFKDPAGNWGISFHGPFVDLPGNGFSDALIRFIVQVDPAFVQRGVRINDAHLFLGGVGVGENSAFIVDESFLESNETMSVFKSTINQGGTKLSDWVYFNPTLAKLNVTKDIFALAADDIGLPARATVIDQSFSQFVPEPATLLISVIGMVALAGYLRKRDLRHNTNA